MSTSFFRYWQLKNNNKSVALGISAIIASYAPAMIYYRVQTAKESAFIRGISEKYRDRIDDDKLMAYVDTLPKQDFKLFASTDDA